MKKLASDAGFDLRKWTSNNMEFLMTVAREDREIQPQEFYSRDLLKILCLPWNDSGDYFTYKFEINEEKETTTKRKILSATASLFDPIGWLSPVTVRQGTKSEADCKMLLCHTHKSIQ